MGQTSRLTATLCGLLCAALTGCGGGGGGHQTAASRAATAELAAPSADADADADAGGKAKLSTPGQLPGDAAPTDANPKVIEAERPTADRAAQGASPYTGLYSKDFATRSAWLTLWVAPDGRIGGTARVTTEHQHIPEILPFSGKWPTSKAQATVEVHDAAGNPWGRVELDAAGHDAQHHINATLTLVQSGGRCPGLC